MYVLLGSNGNIASKVAALLLAQDAAVRVIGRNAKSLDAIKAQGAEIAAGDIVDEGFLAWVFTEAAAVYTMIPTDYAAPDLAASQDRMGEAITRAIVAADVKRVVNLSSECAHLDSGTGPIAGLHRQEQRLDSLADVDVLHIRPGHFFENHLSSIEMILANGIYADMTAPDVPLPMVATADVAQVVARELRTPSGTGKRVLHLRAPRLYTMRESSALLAAAVNRPEVEYVQSDRRLGKNRLLELGFSASAAAMMEEMSIAFSTGELEYENDRAEIAPTTLEQFASTVFSAEFEKAASSRVDRWT
jgi:uncharacterized protein YbjT (DUF2867 family)